MRREVVAAVARAAAGGASGGRRRERRQAARERTLVEALCWRMECTDPVIRASAEAEGLRLPAEVRARD